MSASSHRYSTLFHRHPKNPILTAADWPYPANSVFNPGVTRLPDGSTLLLCRVEDRRGHSHFCAARSRNGVDGWQIDPHPTLMPDPEHHPEEIWGIEDPRITYVPKMGRYVIAYTSYSSGGPCVSLALTRDFVTFERYGVVMPPEDKDAALFPRRIGDYWALIHRPVTPLGAHMWISYSPDLRHWGNHWLLIEARRGAWWDANKIGLCTPPIETEEGWLIIYHGVRQTAGGCLYRLGLALLDLENPQRCLLRGDTWIFGPEAPYEREGDVDNVVFPCGYTLSDDGDTLYLYYGAADTCVALATGSVRALLDWLKQNGRSLAYNWRDQGRVDIEISNGFLVGA
ncbi:MAG: glycosidase [Anaerolineae bacterium]